MQNDKEALTESIVGSTYLLLKGPKLITFEMVNPHTEFFVFKKSRSLELDITEYYKTNPRC